LIPQLPQNDAEPSCRREALEQKRSQYRYNYTINPPLAMADSVPWHDEPSFSWLKLMAVYTLKTLRNNHLAGDVIEHSSSTSRLLSVLADLGRELKTDPDHLVDDIKAAMAEESLHGRPSSIEDYAKLFQSITLPEIAATYREDASFARNFVAATNPLIIERVSGVDDRFPLTDRDLQSVMGPQASLASLGAAGRLFLADYKMLAGAATSVYNGVQKYLYAPLALFAASEQGELVPVAIQLEQAPGPSNPIFRPSHGVNWDIAKLLVMVADCNVSALYFHQARTHMVIEPIVLATHRQLAASHPLFVLLDPHFEGTLFINSLGQKSVFAPGGTIETISAATRDSFRALAVSAVDRFPFYDTSLPANLKSRGVDDPTVLRDYPFRDDGLLVWNAIRDWAAKYIAVYYQSDQDVAGDTELQAWVAELLAEDGGRLQDFGEQGGMKTRAGLVETVTCIIFTSSAQHWALNGPLSTLMAYVPYYPIAAYQPRPTETAGKTEADFLAALPPLEQAQRQLGASYLMGSVRYTTLGEYPRGCFADERVRPLLEGFRAALDLVETTINTRNLGRKTPYPFMRPSVIPQSINI
jgi:arachidonate 15-lipoxygenase